MKKLEKINFSKTALTLSTEGWGRREVQKEDDRAVKALKKILPSLTSLKILNLSINGIEDEQKKELKRANKKVKMIWD